MSPHRPSHAHASDQASPAVRPDGQTDADWGRRSLLVVHREHDGKVYGSWIQDRHGTRAEVRAWAGQTSAVNGGHPIAIVQPVTGPTPILDGPRDVVPLEVVGRVVAEDGQGKGTAPALSPARDMAARHAPLMRARIIEAQDSTCPARWADADCWAKDRPEMPVPRRLERMVDDDPAVRAAEVTTALWWGTANREAFTRLFRLDMDKIWPAWANEVCLHDIRGLDVPIRRSR